MQALNSSHLECLRQALNVLSQGLLANSSKLSEEKPEAVVSVVTKPVEPAKATPAAVVVDVSQIDEHVQATLRIASSQYFPKISWQTLPQRQTADIAEPDDQLVVIPPVSFTGSAESYPACLLKTNADFFGELPWTSGISLKAKAEISEVDEKPPITSTTSSTDQVSGRAFFQGLAWNGQVNNEIKVQPPQADTLPLDAVSMGQLALQSAMKTAARPAQKADYFTLASGHFFHAVFNQEKITDKAHQDQPETTIAWHKNNEFFPRLPW